MFSTCMHKQVGSDVILYHTASFTRIRLVRIEDELIALNILELHQKLSKFSLFGIVFFEGVVFMIAHPAKLQRNNNSHLRIYAHSCIIQCFTAVSTSYLPSGESVCCWSNWDNYNYMFFLLPIG